MLIGIFDQKGPQSDCLRCEVCQNLILSPMNTGLLRHAVATVLTVYGIETIISTLVPKCYIKLQQSLPFTVLKLNTLWMKIHMLSSVATVLTVYGIETAQSSAESASFITVATVLTVYGIETLKLLNNDLAMPSSCNSPYRLRY